MSKLITNTIRHTGGSADNITLDNSQNVTVDGKLGVGVSPSHLVHVKKDTTGGAVGTKIVFENAATDSVNNNVELYLKTARGDFGFKHYNATESYIQVPDQLIINTNNATSATQALHIDTSQNVKVSNGDLLFGAAGKGIVLGVTSNTDANTLDDYEEGTFTPSWVGADTAGSTTYSTNLGSYTKIGNLVNCRGYTTVTGMTGSGSISISNLPFTSTSSDTGLTTGSCMISMLDLHSDAKWIVPYKNAGTSILFLFQSGDSWSWSGVPVDTAWTIAWGITYQSA